jgi:hypothetical protein
MTTTDWEERLAALWSSLDQRSGDDFLAAMRALVAERPADDAAALFELASAHDSTGHSGEAVPLYQRALAIGLSGIRRRRATIQLASSLRITGRAPESVALLQPELDAPSDELDDAVRAFLALALVETGEARRAVGLALGALSRHLPRYQRSLRNYARKLE